MIYAVEIIIVNQESMDSSFDLNKGKVLLSITQIIPISDCSWKEAIFIVVRRDNEWRGWY